MQYYRIRQMLMSSGSKVYLYAWGGLAYILALYTSVKVLLSPDNTQQLILSIAGIIVCTYLAHSIMYSSSINNTSGYIDDIGMDTMSNANLSELLRARKDLMKKLVQQTPQGGSYASMLEDGTTTQLDVVKNDNQSYSCHLKYYDRPRDTFYAHDYIVYSDRKMPVCIKKHETLFPALSPTQAIVYESAEEEVATYDEMLTLYEQLDSLSNNSRSM